MSKIIKRRYKNQRILRLIEKAHAHGLVRWSGDAIADGAGPYWVPCQTLEAFVKFIQKGGKFEHNATTSARLSQKV